MEEKIISKSIEIYYEDEKSKLILGDTFSILSKIKKESIDMI